MTQAGELEEIFGLHQCRGKNPIDSQYADAPQGRGEMSRHDLIILIGEIGQLTAGSSYFLSCVSRGCSRFMAAALRHVDFRPFKSRVTWPATQQLPVAAQAIASRRYGAGVKARGLAALCEWPRYLPVLRPRVLF